MLGLAFGGLLPLGREEKMEMWEMGVVFRKGRVAWLVASGHGDGAELLATVQRDMLWGGKDCVAHGSDGEDSLLANAPIENSMVHILFSCVLR